MSISQAGQTEDVQGATKVGVRPSLVRVVQAQGESVARRDLVLLALMLVGAAYLRFHLLAQSSFWVDEGFSAMAGRLDWSNLLHLLWQREGNMALHYVLLKIWMQFGMSELYVRSLSAVFGLAAIPAVYFLGVRLFSRRAGLIAALLLSLNAFEVKYSQEARGYTLLVLMTALSSLAFVKSVQRPSSRNWWWYTLASVLTVYSHLYGALAIAAHWLSVLCLPPENRDRGGMLRTLRFFGYGMIPVGVFVWRSGSQSMNWVPSPNGAIYGHFFRSLTGNDGWLLLGLYGLAWVAAAYRRWTSGGKRSLESWRYDFLLLSLFFPIVAVIAGSYWKSLFLARYLIGCLPACVLLAASGLARVRPAALRWAMLVLMSALSLQGTLRYYRQDFEFAHDNWRAATRYLLTHAQPGDGIFFYTAPGRMPFEYYRTLGGQAISDPEVLYPSSGERVSYRDFLVTPLAEVFQDPPPHRRRVWVFLNGHRRGGHMDMGSEVVCAWHAQRYRLTGTQTIDNLDLLLYEEKPPDSASQ